MKINQTLTFDQLAEGIDQLSEIIKIKAKSLNANYDPQKGSPVFTVEGKYTTRGWTEWTQGFQYGISILGFELTGDEELLRIGKEKTLNEMAHHLSHFGVHDHGFNNISTYGNLLRLSNQGKFEASEWEKEFYRLALKMSASVQAKRWTNIPEGGYLYSFNGPHSLFIDTIRTARILLLGHQLGHRMLEENDQQVDLLNRAVQHAMVSAKYLVYYGEGRDSYDERGRVSHEGIFNTNDGNYRCPNAQQGFSGFTTWTRGLAWAMVGFSEFIEFIDAHKSAVKDYANVRETLMKAAQATCDFYIDNSAADGITYWDTGAPKLHLLGDWRNRDAEPYNDFEPVDSSASAIGAQGMLRLGRLLLADDPQLSKKYTQAGLTTLQALLTDEYTAQDVNHQGLLLHTIYHEPNGWDHKPQEGKAAAGESSMWGDYHLVELAVLAKSIANNGYYRYFDDIK